MSENPYRAPEPEEGADRPGEDALREPGDSLGPLVLACRGRSTKDYMFELGFEFTYLRGIWIGVVFLTLGISLLLAGALKFASVPLDANTRGVVFCVAVVASVALVFWLTSREPRKSPLFLYRDGFRSKGVEFRFDALKSIVIGRDDPRGKRSESQGLIDDATVTVTLKNGYSRSFRGVLLGVKEEDADEFIQRIRAAHPTLLTEKRRDRGMGDFKFRMTQVG